MNNFAANLNAQGKYEQAQEAYERVLTIAQKVLGADHPVSVRIMANLGHSFCSEGRYAKAEGVFETILKMKSRPRGAPDYWPLSAAIALAKTLQAQDKHAEAAALLRKQLGHRFVAKYEGHWQLAYAKSLFGHCLTGAGKHDEAEPLLLSGYTTMKNHPSTPIENVREGLEWIVECYESTGKTNEAAQWRTILAATLVQDR